MFYSKEFGICFTLSQPEMQS